MNIQDEASFGCVSRARTKDFKEGLASLAWKNLVEKYEGLEKSNKMDLKRELLSSHLNKNDDPDGWITKLEKIKWELENNHNEFMSEEDFLTQIIILLPQEYDLLYNSFQLQINNGSDTLTTEKLRKQLSWHYDRVIKKNSRDNNVHMAHNHDKNRSKKRK